MKSTKAHRVYNTMQFMHKQITQPALMLGDTRSKAAHDPIKALRDKQNGLGEQHKHNLQQLSSIFKDVAKKQKQNSPAV